MQLQSRRNTLNQRWFATPAQRWLAWGADLLGMALLIAIVSIAATFLTQPYLRIDASNPDATRWLIGFWKTEHNNTDTFRWSQMESGIRLFGFEQRAPLSIQTRLTSVREPGQAPAQLTISTGQSQTTFALTPTWRVYQIALPVPERGAESPFLAFHSTPTIVPSDSRDLGFVLNWLRVTQTPLTVQQRLPDPSRIGFLALLGMLVYVALRRVLHAPGARLAMLAFTFVLGLGIASAPGSVAYWLPNLWTGLLVAALVLFAPPIVAMIQRNNRFRSFIVPLGILALLGAQVLLPVQRSWSNWCGWALLCVGGILLAARLHPPEWDTPNKLTRRTVGQVLLLCTGLALLLRLAVLNDLPLGMWRDEARHGLQALRILHDPHYRPVYVPVVADIPALLFYLDALPIAAFGQQPWTVRLVPALAGALTPLALYWALRPIIGIRIALATAALISLSVWHIALSRLAFAATLGPPLTALAIGFIWRTLHAVSQRRQYLYAGLAGTCSGLAIYTYHPSRLTSLVVALVVLVVLGFDWRAWLAALPRLLVALALLLIVLAPLGNYALRHSDDFSRRVNQTFILRAGLIDSHAPAWVIEQNVSRVAGMWNAHGDDNGRHNVSGAPMLDPLMGLCFVAGASVLLTRLRDQRTLILLVWMGVMLIPAVLSVEEPHAVRTVETIIPTMLLVALGAIALLNWLAEQWPQHLADRRARVLSLAFLGCVLALNSWRYFVTWPSTLPAYTEYYVADTHMGEFAQYLINAPEIQHEHYAIFVVAPRNDDDVLDYLTLHSSIIKVGGDQIAIRAGEQPLLIVRGNLSSAERAHQLLGDNATRIGAGPRSPDDHQPEFVVYGRGAADPLIVHLLETWLGS